MKIDLAGKIAVITGGAAGIGQACARLMVENAAQVVIADIAEEEGARAATELSTIGRCHFISTDVSRDESARDLVKQVVDEFEKIDIFVNNAGVAVSGQHRVCIHEFPDEEWERVIGTDLNGVFYCSRAVSQVMIGQGGGRQVVVLPR